MVSKLTTQDPTVGKIERLCTTPLEVLVQKKVVKKEGAY